MKQHTFTGLLALCSSVLIPCLPLHAQPSAHYVPGVEGIKGASLPPPGLYFRDYNVGYYSERLRDASGDKTGPGNFSAFTYANVPRVVYISDCKLLGGYVGVDGFLPLIWQGVRAGGFDRDTFGIGDFFAESTLSWHWQHLDLSAGLGVWAPTGDSASPPTTRVGAGYWTPMITAGGTWFIDEKREWAVSILNRYEFNTEQRDTDIRPGQALTIEYGISKAVAQTVDVGIVGYYQQQTTKDAGRGSAEARDWVVGVGPEVAVACPKHMLFTSLRYVCEVASEARAQGHTFVLTLTKRF